MVCSSVESCRFFKLAPSEEPAPSEFEELEELEELRSSNVGTFLLVVFWGSVSVDVDFPCKPDVVGF